MAPDIAPAGVLPVTLVGWVTAIGLLITLVLQLVQMGRFLQKLDGIRVDFGELNTTVGIMDTHLDSLSQTLRDLVVEWRGVDGNNGGRAKIKEIEKRVRVIEERHLEEDAVTRIERQEGRGERRRLRDKLIDRDPEE